MYRIDTIKDKFSNLLGWRQHHGEAMISESLTNSESGMYYQDMHPLVTLDNIKSIAPDFGNEEEFSQWLREKTNASILRAISILYDEKLADKTLKSLLESKVLFSGAGRLTDVVKATNSIVGFELVPLRAQGATLRIEKIGLQFTQPGKVKLYVMHSSQAQPVRTKEIEYTGNGSFQWVDVDIYLPYLSSESDAGGSWFLCYDEKELPEGMRAIEKSKDWSKEPCRGCSRGEYESWQAWSKYLEVHPFKAQGVLPDMWDIADNVYTYTTNYGINLMVTMQCDITDILVSQRMSLANMIGLQVASDMIREFAYNPNFRINRMAHNFSRTELLYELDGDSQGTKKSGLVYELAKAREAVNLDISGISRVCLPCGKQGIRYRTV